jgi:hypothetical protein
VGGLEGEAGEESSVVNERWAEGHTKEPKQLRCGWPDEVSPLREVLISGRANGRL